MITLKLRTYSAHEIDILDDMLCGLIHEIKQGFCHNSCKDCNFRHLCVDLQSAQLYSSDTLTNRQG